MGQWPHVPTCTVSSEGSMSCTKDNLYGNSARTKSSSQKEYFYRGYVHQYTERRYIKSVACTNMHVHVTICVCVQTYLLTYM